jgi:hypothetical protein
MVLRYCSVKKPTNKQTKQKQNTQIYDFEIKQELSVGQQRSTILSA